MGTMQSGESTQSGLLRRTPWALAAVVLVAAALRFVGLDHELRAGEGAMVDEVNNFVEPALRMWKERSLDPAVTAGYPGFFNYLVILPVKMGERLGGHDGAYIGARALIAAFGLLNVVLMHALVRRVAGPVPAIFAAGLLALSRAEIREAHQVSPDVVLVALMLGMLLALSRERTGWGSDAFAGALIGVAIAIKYTGALLLPGLLVGVAVNRRFRTSIGPTLLGVMSGFMLAAPFAVLAAFRGGGRFGAGVLVPILAYYGDTPGQNQFVTTGLSHLGSVIGLLEMNLGWASCGLAVLGLLRHRPTRALLPLATIALVFVGALSAANYFYPRHGLILSSTMTVFAACGFAVVERLWPRRGLVPALGFAALVIPALTAAPLVSGYAGDVPAEAAARWLEANAAPKTRVVTSFAVLRLDRKRFEVSRVRSLDELPRAALEFYSLVLTSQEAEVARLGEMADIVKTFGPSTVLFRPRRAPEWRPAPPPDDVAASEHLEEARLPWDGNWRTLWVGSGSKAWLEARWNEPVVIEAIDVDAGRQGLWPRDLQLTALDENGVWRSLDLLALRPQRPEAQREGTRPGQFFFLARPESIRGLRIVQLESDERWGVSEIRPMEARGH